MKFRALPGQVAAGPVGQCSRTLLPLAVAGLVAGCSTFAPAVKGVRDTLWGPSHPYLSGYVGIVVADEPQAAVAGHDVLVRGGNAADAATAVGLALAVTLPSRASLGSGGACLAYRPGQPGADSFLFLPVGGSVSGSRPAAVPMVVRGLYRMQIQYGSVDFSETLPPAIRLARAGATVSSQLASDLEVVKAPLLEDEGMSAVFSRGDGSVLQAGDTVAQPALAATLERIRHVGPGDLYNGALASSLAEGAATAGGGLTAADIRAALPARLESLALQNGGTRIDFVAPPADGGLGMAAAWHAAQGGTSVGGIGQSSVAAWRAAHSQTTDVAAAQAFVSSPPSGGRLPNLPASTSFAVVDRTGEAVACDLTMNNLFGTGRMAGSTGIVLGVAPGRNPAPLLPIAIAHHNGVVQAVVAASGQNDAADAAAAGLSNALAGRAGTANVGAGRVNSIVCGSHTCSGATDVRGGGLATGTN